MASAHASTVSNPAGGKGDGLQTLPKRRRRPALLVCVASFLLGLGWHLLFPLINITSGEPKPRSTFISENAILQHASPAYSALDAQRALAMQALFTRDFQRRKSQQNESSVPARHALHDFTVSWLQKRCGQEAMLQTEVQPSFFPSTSPPSADSRSPSPPLVRLTNVVCTARARGMASGKEYLLFSATVDASRDSGTAGHNVVLLGDKGDLSGSLPHEAFVLLSFAQQLADSPWLAKDAVFVFSVYSWEAATSTTTTTATTTTMNSGKARARVLESEMEAQALRKKEAAALGLEAFLSAHDYEPPSSLSTSTTPSKYHHGVLRAALSIDFASSVPVFRSPTPSTTATTTLAPPTASSSLSFIPEPSHLAISLLGPSGKTPELDFATLAISAFKLRFPSVVLADAADGRTLLPRTTSSSSPSSRSILPPHLTAPTSLVAAQARVSQWGRRSLARLSALASPSNLNPGSASSRALLHSFIDSVAAPLTRFIQGKPHASVSVGDCAEYASRLLSYVLTTLRMVLGPFSPHAAVLAKGGGAYHAATLTFGRRQDFISKLPADYYHHQQQQQQQGSNTDANGCFYLSPCDYRQRVLSLPSIASFASEVDSFETKVALSLVGTKAAPNSGEDASTAGSASALALASADAGSSSVVNTVVSIGQGIERIARGMSGTEERLHASLQSNGYILLSPTLFVGMHEFLSASALLHIPALVIAIASLPSWSTDTGGSSENKTIKDRGRGSRDFVVVELLCYAALLAIGALKAFVLWSPDPSSSSSAFESAVVAAETWLSGASRAQLGRDGVRVAVLFCFDAVAALVLVPLLRKLLLSTYWCLPVVPVADDARAVKALEGEPGGAEKAAVEAPSPSPSSSISPSLSSALFVACVGFLIQQLQILYLHYALFLVACLFAVPVFIAVFFTLRLFDATLGKGGLRGLAASAAVFVIVVGAYLCTSPQGWALLMTPSSSQQAHEQQQEGGGLTLYSQGASAAWELHSGLAAVFQGSGYSQYQFPVLLHLQALFGLLASACVGF